MRVRRRVSSVRSQPHVLAIAASGLKAARKLRAAALDRDHAARERRAVHVHVEDREEDPDAQGLLRRARPRSRRRRARARRRAQPRCARRPMESRVGLRKKATTNAASAQSGSATPRRPNPNATPRREHSGTPRKYASGATMPVGRSRNFGACASAIAFPRCAHGAAQRSLSSSSGRRAGSPSATASGRAAARRPSPSGAPPRCAASR